MPSTLAHIYGRLCTSKVCKNQWEQAVCKAFDGPLCSLACSKLVDDIENAALTTPDAIRRAYRKRLTLKFISPDTALTSLPVNRKGEIEALFFSILENELVDYKSIEKALSLTDMIESGLLLMILGMIRQDESILLEALDKALLVIELLDRKGCPFSGLFCRPETFSHAAVYGMGYLLFATAASITEWPKYHLVAESMLTHFKDLPEACLAKVSPYHIALSLFLEKALCEKQIPLIKGTPRQRSYEKELGLASYHHESLSLACTTTGDHSGICGLSKGGVRIVSIGPSRHPIGEDKNFGIMRIPPTSDVLVEKGEESFDFVGWSRLASPKEGDLSKTWMEFQLKGRRGRSRIGVKFTDLEEKLHFLFFVQGEKAVVGDTFALEPASLDRYTGNEGRVAIRSGSQTLNIQSVGKSELEVIPLAGNDHYWGANFLIAYTLLTDCSSMTWDIF